MCLVCPESVIAAASLLADEQPADKVKRINVGLYSQFKVDLCRALDTDL